MTCAPWANTVISCVVVVVVFDVFGLIYQSLLEMYLLGSYAGGSVNDPLFSLSCMYHANSCFSHLPDEFKHNRHHHT